MPSVSATESPKRRTRTGCANVGAPGDVVVVPPLVPMPTAGMPAMAGVVVVAAMSATRTAPTPAGTTSQARHWLTNVPIRMGRSTRWNETTDTPKVTATRTGKQLPADEARPLVVQPDEDRPMPDVEAVEIRPT